MSISNEKRPNENWSKSRVETVTSVSYILIPTLHTPVNITDFAFVCKVDNTTDVFDRTGLDRWVCSLLGLTTKVYTRLSLTHMYYDVLTGLIMRSSTISRNLYLHPSTDVLLRSRMYIDILLVSCIVGPLPWVDSGWCTFVSQPTMLGVSTTRIVQGCSTGRRLPTTTNTLYLDPFYLKTPFSCNHILRPLGPLYVLTTDTMGGYINSSSTAVEDCPSRGKNLPISSVRLILVHFLILTKPGIRKLQI